MQNSKNAFTMIELIFVIVILGILAAVAIPKISATRDDAKVASEVNNAAIVLQNLAAEFTAKGAFTNYTVNDANNAVECFTFSLNSAADGNISLAVIGIAKPACSASVLASVTSVATKNGLLGAAGSLKTYVFSASGIVP